MYLPEPFFIKINPMKILPFAGMIILFLGSCASQDKESSNGGQEAKEEQLLAARVDSVLQLMTLEEKIGQLNHLKGSYSTDIYTQSLDVKEEIRQGRVGALTTGEVMDQLIEWQKVAVEQSRLGIPLIFANDVIHGYRTIFPIPLGQAASWDMETIEKAERITATEASSVGLHWTFAPMVDIVRDPRWGRCMEAAGEDTYLASRIARARVRGLQGSDLAEINTMLACAKHFAGYGAAEGGMEYNTVDLSERVLREIYLPPFKSAVDEGLATIMNGFNVLDRIPVSANKHLITDILKNEWGFEGFTVSDAFSFYELIPHGIASNEYEAALKCFTAGSDTDLWGQLYIQNLEQLVQDGTISEKQIDVSVSRVLRAKFQLGLFDRPYAYFDQDRMDSTLMHPDHLIVAEELARKSLVLLKNEMQVLPLSKIRDQKIALIGPLANSTVAKNLMGNWSGNGKEEDVVTIFRGLMEKEDHHSKISFSRGCGDWGICSDNEIQEAVALARRSDIIVLAIGEHGWSSGECASRADISLPGDQEKLIQALHKTGVPIVGLIFSGRPLVISEEIEMLDAVLMCWQPGIMAGHAVADVIFGDYNPSGKLPMTIPFHQGQIPIYYNHLRTGRPRLGPEDKRWGVNKWSEVPNEPLFPFGFGLSYTEFAYSDISLSADIITVSDTLELSVLIENAGDYDGEEVVQLYICDESATVTRPAKELKKFRKLFIPKGKSEEVKFQLTDEDLKYWNIDMNYELDPGWFTVYVGSSSADTLQSRFELTE